MRTCQRGLQNCMRAETADYWCLKGLVSFFSFGVVFCGAASPHADTPSYFFDSTKDVLWYSDGIANLIPQSWMA